MNIFITFNPNVRKKVEKSIGHLGEAISPP